VIEIQEATAGAAAYIAQNLRESDREELIAAYGDDIAMAVMDSYRLSQNVWVAYVDNVPFSIFGVAQSYDYPDAGVIWLLGTDEILKNQMSFLRGSKEHFKQMVKLYPFLYNFTHVNNKAAQRWLRWLGFTLEDPEPYGLKGELFIPFYRRNNDV